MSATELRRMGPACLAIVLHTILAGRAALGQDASVLEFRMGKPRLTAPIVALHERTRIGSVDGEQDAFGLVSDAVLTRQGLIVVADAMSSALLLFDLDGQRVARVGRAGDGPGEFRFPAVLSVDPWDSLFVWDSRHRRVSVFADAKVYVRSFPLPPSWFVTSIVPLRSGELLIAAMGTGVEHAIHRVDRGGVDLGEFGPSPFEPLSEPFEATLLGGYVALAGTRVAYSNKSPYEIWIFDEAMRLERKCVGDEDWTTRPRDAVARSLESVRLKWKSYVHTARLLALSDSLLLNVIFDPVQDRRVLDVVTTRCQLLRREVIRGRIMFTDSQRGLLLAVRRLEYPEVLLYQVQPVEASLHLRRDP